MIQQTPQADKFKQQISKSLREETANSRAITITKRASVYFCGDQDKTVYFVESGRIKLLVPSPGGKECLLAILGAGDIFGELCLSGLSERRETATAIARQREVQDQELVAGERRGERLVAVANPIGLEPGGAQLLEDLTPERFVVFDKK